MRRFTLNAKICLPVLILLTISCGKKKESETYYAITTDRLETLSYGGLRLEFNSSDTIDVVYNDSIQTSNGPITEGKTYKYKSKNVTKAYLLNLLANSSVCTRSNSSLVSHCSAAAMVLRRSGLASINDIDVIYTDSTNCEKEYYFLCRDKGIVNALQVVVKESQVSQ